MSRRTTLQVWAQIGNGPVVRVRGRVAWALLALMKSGEHGCAPIHHPGPRWSGYVHDLRKLGFAIETVRERHGGEFPGDHARYVLRSPVVIADGDSARRPANPSVIVRDMGDELTGHEQSKKRTSGRF